MPSATNADGTPGWYWQEWQDAGKVWNRVKDMHHRMALKRLLDLKVPGVMIGVARDSKEADHPEVEQCDVLFLPRHHSWLQGQAFDQYPDLKHDRSEDGDEDGFDSGDRLLKRVGHESGEMREWRAAITDAWWSGSAFVWYGYDDDVASLDKMADVSKGTGQAVDEALHGQHVPTPGQDHKTIGPAMMSEASKAEVALGAQGEQIQVALLNAGVQHAKMAEKDAKRPRNWTQEPRSMWTARGPAGTVTRWSANATDFNLARVVMRRLVLDVDVARSIEDFKPAVRALLTGGSYARSEGYEGEAVEGDGDRVKANECIIIEVWDRKWDTRHYVAEGIEEFLEKDDTNPWIEESGRCKFKTGVPVACYAPCLSADETPHRPFGVPIGAYGWEMQRLIIKLASHNLDGVKKLTVRMVELLGELAEEEEEAVASGQTGTILHRTADLNTNELKGLPLVRPIDFGTVDAKVFEQIVWAERTLSKVLAWPLSQMTGEPQANTATAEKIAVEAGTSQMGDLIRELEAAVAHGQEIKRAIVWGYYSREDVADLIGQGSANTFFTWRQKFPSVRGDRIMVRLAATMNGEDPVRRDQVKEVIEALSAIPSDKYPGKPKYRLDGLVKEWVRLHGLAEPTEWEPTPEEMAAMAATPPQGAPGEPASGGKPGSNGSRGAPGKGAPERTRSAQFSAVQRN